MGILWGVWGGEFQEKVNIKRKAFVYRKSL